MLERRIPEVLSPGMQCLFKSWIRRTISGFSRPLTLLSMLTSLAKRRVSSPHRESSDLFDTAGSYGPRHLASVVYDCVTSTELNYTELHNLHSVTGLQVHETSLEFREHLQFNSSINLTSVVLSYSTDFIGT